MIPNGIFKMLLPLACGWAEEQESLILKEGVALTDAQLASTRRIAIVHPERVRLRVVERIPLPLNPILRGAAERTGLISPLTAGLTLRYGIFIRSDFWGDSRLLVHELAHVAQYERFGSFHAFLEAYLNECVNPPGYPFGPLEQEAKRIESEICL